MFREDAIIRSFSDKVNQIIIFIIFCFGIILARLWYLQIYKGNVFLNYSLENRLEREVILAPRGIIFSRNNEIIVYNAPRFDAVVIPQYLKDRKKTISKIAKILSIKERQIGAILRKKSQQAKFRPVIIKKNISRKEVAIIETESEKIPGVMVKMLIRREYKDKKVGSHFLGYISEISQKQLPKYRKRDRYHYKLGDFIGQAGIEEKLDPYLRGKDGHEFIEIDAGGRVKRRIQPGSLFHGIKNKITEPGNNLRLTIDRDLQLAAYKALENKVGSIVAVDIYTGEVLAMVSRPSFNSGNFSVGLTENYWKQLTQDSRNPLRDRTIQEHYAPGSTFKLMTAITALEENMIDEKTKVKCTGSFKLGRRKFHCWKKRGHGIVDIYKSIRESCDVFYYKIASQLNIDILAKYANKFGFGKKTGIELSREVPGLIPTKDWKKKRNGKNWVQGETLSCAIGQSFVLATPLQLAMAYSVIANGGKLFKPKLVREIFSNNGYVKTRKNSKLIKENQFKEKTLSIIRKGLWQAVNHPRGTAWWNRAKGANMAGKTGTSQVVSFSEEQLFEKCELKEYKLRHHGIFAAYAPMKNPKIAIGVVVEHGCHGSTAAAPVASAVANTYMKKYYPEEYKNFLLEDRKRYIQFKKKRIQ